METMEDLLKAAYNELMEENTLLREHVALLRDALRSLLNHPKEEKIMVYARQVYEKADRLKI